MADIPTEMISMAAGCVMGDPYRVSALMMVCFGDYTEREAQVQTGIEKTKIRRDRKRFQKTCEKYHAWRQDRDVKATCTNDQDDGQAA